LRASVERVKYIVYMISAPLAGLAGLVETAEARMGDPSKVGVNGIRRDRGRYVGGTPSPVGRANVLGTVVGSDHAGDLHELQHSFRLTWSLVLKP